MNNKIHLIECPRDAMQGWKSFIETNKKIEYLNALLQVGFHTIDFGSFVSPKSIPQLKDTSEVLKHLHLDGTTTKLLAIIANRRGAEEAAEYDQITYLGFPFSISPTFQRRNTNSTIEESITRLEDIQEICKKKNKKLVLYLSMAFGNPYGDVYNENILLKWADEVIKREVEIISLADTVGLAQPDQISFALNELVPKYNNIEFGVHLHSSITNWNSKVEAAYNAGCTRFDGALKGIGGCPMAGDELVGNINTEWLLSFFDDQNESFLINKEALNKSLRLAEEIFV